MPQPPCVPPIPRLDDSLSESYHIHLNGGQPIRPLQSNLQDFSVCIVDNVNISTPPEVSGVCSRISCPNSYIMTIHLGRIPNGGFRPIFHYLKAHKELVTFKAATLPF